MPNELYLPEEQGWSGQLQSWLDTHRIFLVAGLGSLLLLFGGFSFLSGIFEQPKVEVLSEDKVLGDGSEGKLTVEIAGAVSEPGVYELLASDRVERLLIAAGGLSAEASREWVEKNLNRASKLVDGQKIYIPTEEEVEQSMESRGSIGSTGSFVGTGSVAGVQTGLININSASQGELEKLKGIGPARATGIIENRPYTSIEELVSKKVLPKSVFEQIKGQITAP